MLRPIRLFYACLPCSRKHNLKQITLQIITLTVNVLFMLLLNCKFSNTPLKIGTPSMFRQNGGLWTLSFLWEWHRCRMGNTWLYFGAKPKIGEGVEFCDSINCVKRKYRFGFIPVSNSMLHPPFAHYVSLRRCWHLVDRLMCIIIITICYSIGRSIHSIDNCNAN